MRFTAFYLNEDYDDNIGKALAKKYNCIYNGWWEDLGRYTFTDKKTKSTFAAKDEKEFVKELKDMRDSFAKFD